MAAWWNWLKGRLSQICGAMKMGALDSFTCFNKADSDVKKWFSQGLLMERIWTTC